METSPSVPSDWPTPDARFGRFRVLRHLGSGGMGVVVEAEHDLLGTRVALKLMKPQQTTNPTSHKRFLREARGQSMVKHPHVVPILYFDEHEGTPFIVMPLLQGETLAARLYRVGTLSPCEVARVGRETAEGLQAAHELGVFHNDVKPGNVWLEAPNDTVRLMDFGLCQRREDVRLTTDKVPGTLAYMAPEREKGQRGGVASDLYSLGVLLYEAATGTRSFYEDRRYKRARARRPDLPKKLDQLIQKLTEARPERRPPSARVVADALRAVEWACQ